MSVKTKRAAEARRIAAVDRKRRRAKLAMVTVGMLGMPVLGLAAFGFSSVVAAPPAPSATLPATSLVQRAGDAARGSVDAPVTVVEYASFTCSFCAAFHSDHMPAFVANYVDTGKVRFLYRPHPVDGTSLEAARVMACVPEGERWAAMDALAGDIRSIASAGGGTERLVRTAVDRENATPIERARLRSDVLGCLEDGSETAEMEAAIRSSSSYVSGTPTFNVNGKVFSGLLSSKVLGRIVEAELASGGAS